MQHLPIAYFNAFASPDTHKHCLWSYAATNEAFSKRHNVYTSQMSFMAYAWFEGYEVYIVDNKGYPFKVCNESGLTNKQLRPEHNIFKIFAAGGFGSQFLE